jgi:hypothetical protein
MHRRILVVLVLALAGLLAGCGGSSSSESPHEEVQKVANQFSAAFGAGDIKRACAYWGAQEDEDHPGTCVRIYSGGLGASYHQSFLTADIERVAVTGDTATVAYSNETIAKLKKTEEGWVIDELGEAKYYSGLEEEEGSKELEKELEEEFGE